MTADRDTRRLLKQAERDKRIAELYGKNPRLKKLDDRLAETGRAGLLRVWEGGGLADVQKEIALLQKKREELLSSLGLDEQVYDVAWDCPLCQDRGYIRPGETCGCQRRDDGMRRFMDSGLSPLQKKMRFDTFSLEWYDRPEAVADLTAKLRQFADRLSSADRFSSADSFSAGEYCGNLFLAGPVGNGKTHLSSAVANQVLAAGKTVIYTRAEELLEALREDFYGRGERGERPEKQWTEKPWAEKQRAEKQGPERQEKGVYGRGILPARLLRADLLILEDLGDERLTDFAEEQLTGLIDQRINWQKPWLITSHLTGDKFNKRYSQRLVDRVLGEGRHLFLNESSIRFKKAQKERAAGLNI